MLAVAILSASLASGYGVLFTLVGDFRDLYGVSEAMIGVIMGAGFITSFVAQLFLAPFGDRGFARVMILGGTLVYVLGMLGLGFSQSAPLLLMSRVISGIGIGTATPAIKRVVVVSSGDNLGRNLGLLMSADIFGFAVGPVLSALLVGPFGIPAPFIIIAAITTAFTLWLNASRFNVPETKSENESERFAFDLLKDRRVLAAVCIGASTWVMIGAFDALWDLVHSDLGTPDWIANIGISVFSVPLFLFAPFAGTMAQRHGPYLVAYLGMVCAVAFFGIYGVLSSGVVLVLVSFLHSVTDGLTFPASGVAVGLVAPKERQASAQGMLGALQALAAGLISPVAGWTYGNFGQSAAYWVTGVAFFVLASVGFVLAGSLRFKPIPAA